MLGRICGIMPPSKQEFRKECGMVPCYDRNSLDPDWIAQEGSIRKETNTMKKVISKVSRLASQAREDHDRYLNADGHAVRPDNEYWGAMQEYGVMMMEAAPYEVKCEMVMKSMLHAVKNRPEYVLREMLSAMNSESFSMNEFCWDFGMDYFMDLLFAPGKKMNAARMR